MNIITNPSPNFDSRNGEPVELLIMHYTGMLTGEGALERLCDAEAKVSSHYLVEEDGRVFQLVDEDQRAWHAGVASWGGRELVNARSIGIEIVNPGHEHGYRAFPKTQMAAVEELATGILSRHAIKASNVIGHSDVAPTRKEDPGELFDWASLAAQGIGLWPDKVGYNADVQEESEVCRRLSAYGYGVENVPFDALARAFQRHFRQAQVNGVWDGECSAILDNLLKKR